MCDAAIAAAGSTGDDAALNRALAELRVQLALLETLAARWPQERAQRAASRSAADREEIAAWLRRPRAR